MKSINIFSFIMCLLFLSIVAYTQPTTTKHVVLIGIGGVSAEGFQYSETPALNNLISQGVISLKTRGVMPIADAPNWATVLSGAGPEQHGVTSNDWSHGNQNLEPTIKDADGYFASIFTLIGKQFPKAATAMFYDWEWLGSFVNKKYITKEQYVQGQVMITSVALNYIKKEKPLFTFIYYGYPEEVGHSKGFDTKDYFQSITDIDAEIGKLIDGIKESGIAQTTTILITSGGIGLGRSVQSLEEIEVPWIVSGAGIKKGMLLETPNDLANTAPTIARILGIKIPAEWIGRPVNDVLAAKTPFPKTNRYVPKPNCSLADGSFPGPQQIELTTTLPGSTIYYTLDGSNPDMNSKKYTSPFTISTNCTLKAVSLSGNNASQAITRQYTFIQGNKTATLTTQPSQKYPGSGVSGLFDGLIGSSNHTNKQWMGYEGDDFEVTVDLGEVKPIKTMGIYVLQMPSESIFLPAAVEYSCSDDGKNYRLLNTFYPSETDDIRLDGPVMLARNFDNISARYVRIKASNIGTCPATHPNEGQKAWLFVSEVEIE
ncbi:MAG: alkaline phosphatase family protein [Bacteroidota bacterium]